jgi:predicted nucleic acid-binding protein
MIRKSEKPVSEKIMLHQKINIESQRFAVANLNSSSGEIAASWRRAIRLHHRFVSSSSPALAPPQAFIAALAIRRALRWLHRTGNDADRILSDAGLAAQACAPQIDRSRAVGIDLDDRNALGAGHRRDVEHKLAIEGKSAFAGGGWENNPAYEEARQPRAVTPGDARHHFSSLNGNRDEVIVARSPERATAS